jgi:hypothetical protein
MSLLPLDCPASTYRSDFRIQNQIDRSKAPAAGPSQLVPYESTAIFLRPRNRSISASIDLNRVLQLNTFGVRPPSYPMFNNEHDLMSLTFDA